ncbi:murein hydrolase activator EnvC family protein [Croceicoccus mobilis]|uniref:M23ase beta-sheet core domain-containing protein n=1 Tax=Croceicoccus mobilis TaxID=1703339 RepID=A0A916YT25_9SPHN|nr:peptidoglycan DD-metalloendopeptidase family protein [Croceicoccus mobilis]GGD59803.1 hypothetical protein GCM10010990_06490 [Croceicoccus mobilis]
MRRALYIVLPLATLGLLVPAAAQMGEAISADSLAEAEAARIAAQKRARELAERAKRIEDDALKAEAEAEALSAEITETEARIEEARQRETLAADRLGLLRERLARQRAPLSRMLAALQRLARRPMILLVLRPASIKDYVRTRAMISALTPQIARETGSLRSDLGEVKQLVASSAQSRAQRERASEELERRRAEYRASGAESRLAAREMQTAAGEARREATIRGVEAQSIAALVTKQDENRRTGARLAEFTGPLLPENRPLASARVRPQLPSTGRIVAGFGERDAAGGRARGLTIATAPAAPVAAPLAGTVEFARQWRGYGTVVILRHADGYLSLVAGLDGAQVKPGQKVAKGEMLGRTGQANPRLLYELRRNGRPVHPLLAN